MQEATFCSIHDTWGYRRGKVAPVALIRLGAFSSVMLRLGFIVRQIDGVI
jgi:hypothetical protein